MAITSAVAADLLDGNEAVEREASSARARPPDRVNLKLSERAARRLEDLRKITDAPTNAEVVRDALRVYDYLISEIQKGHKICLQDEAGKITALKVLFM